MKALAMSLLLIVPYMRSTALLSRPNSLNLPQQASCPCSSVTTSGWKTAIDLEGIVAGVLFSSGGLGGQCITRTSTIGMLSMFKKAAIFGNFKLKDSYSVALS